MRFIILIVVSCLFLQSALLANSVPQTRSFKDFDIKPLEETTVESAPIVPPPFVSDRAWGIQAFCNSTGLRMGMGLTVKNPVDQLTYSTVSLSKTIFTDLRSSFADGKYYTSADEYTLLLDRRAWIQGHNYYVLLGIGIGGGTVSNSLLTDYFVKISYRLGLGTKLDLFKSDLDTNLCLNLDVIGYNLEKLDIFILPFEIKKFSPSVSLNTSYYF